MLSNSCMENRLLNLPNWMTSTSSNRLWYALEPTSMIQYCHHWFTFRLDSPVLNCSLLKLLLFKMFKIPVLAGNVYSIGSVTSVHYLTIFWRELQRMKHPKGVLLSGKLSAANVSWCEQGLSTVDKLWCPHLGGVYAFKWLECIIIKLP